MLSGLQVFQVIIHTERRVRRLVWTETSPSPQAALYMFTPFPITTRSPLHSYSLPWGHDEDGLRNRDTGVLVMETQCPSIGFIHRFPGGQARFFSQSYHLVSLTPTICSSATHSLPTSLALSCLTVISLQKQQFCFVYFQSLASCPQIIFKMWGKILCVLLLTKVRKSR